MLYYNNRRYEDVVANEISSPFNAVLQHISHRKTTNNIYNPHSFVHCDVINDIYDFGVMHIVLRNYFKK